MVLIDEDECPPSCRRGSRPANFPLPNDWRGGYPQRGYYHRYDGPSFSNFDSHPNNFRPWSGYYAYDPYAEHIRDTNRPGNSSCGRTGAIWNVRDMPVVSENASNSAGPVPLDDELLQQVRNLRDPSKSFVPYMGKRKNKSLNIELAAIKLVEHLSTDASKIKAREAINAAQLCLMRNNNVQFADHRAWLILDNGIFQGLLTPAVNFDLADPGDYRPSICGQTFAPGRLELYHPVPRIAVRINPSFTPESFTYSNCDMPEPVCLLISLIHQMVHAWLPHLYGAQHKAREADGRLGHDQRFWKIIYTISDAFTFNQTYASGDPADAMFNIFANKVHHEAFFTYSGSYDDISRARSFDKSFCEASAIQVSSRSQAEQWYKTMSRAAKLATSESLYGFDPANSKIKEIPRHEAGSPSDYVEVEWDGTCFHYARKRAKEFQSLRQFFFADVGSNESAIRKLKLPRNVPTELFRCVDTFIKDGSDYYPPRDKWGTLGSSLGPGILRVPVDYSRPSRLFYDVQAYQLGSLIGFTELRDRALERLETMPATSLDPLPALRAIYGRSRLAGPERHRQARTD